ncbi:MAG: hypothetical protein QFX32_01940 [Methanolinea sp.]|nr:hypothetical protein [Methanolinea sp.]
MLDSLPGTVFSLADDPATRNTLLSAGEGEFSSRYAGTDFRAVFTIERTTGWKVAVAWRD